MRSDGGRTREHQVIERQRRERLRRGDRAAEHRDLVLREHLREQCAHRRGGPRRVLGHLDHRAVAGRDGRDQRPEREVHREVPRGDDADDSLRLVHHEGAIGGEQQLGMARARPHPAREVAPRVVDLEHRPDHVGQLRLEKGAAAEVGVDGGRQPVLVSPECNAQRLEPGAALLERGVRVRRERRPLRGMHRAEARDLGRLVGARCGDIARRAHGAGLVLRCLRTR